ncbi:hypothetical protein EVAR_30587_1 [Eumeta japonica]|uniref:Uncharacterized protein n=1 Tax=Eumeta variegata TaxID=151549 RepID=A0A4C1WAF7_EUMVA|nr:hypothetical protein EVAR_30587_1 [Eumeta japonica]
MNLLLADLRPCNVTRHPYRRHVPNDSPLDEPITRLITPAARRGPRSATPRPDNGANEFIVVHAATLKTKQCRKSPARRLSLNGEVRPRVVDATFLAAAVPIITAEVMTGDTRPGVMRFVGNHPIIIFRDDYLFWRQPARRADVFRKSKRRAEHAVTRRRRVLFSEDRAAAMIQLFSDSLLVSNSILFGTFFRSFAQKPLARHTMIFQKRFLGF